MTDDEAPEHRNAAIASANFHKGEVEASAGFDTTPERLFRALTSQEICNWWVRPGVFNTKEWSGNVREGGRWAAAGIGRGQPYQLEGKFVTIDEPHLLIQTWQPVGAPGDPAMLTFNMEPQAKGVRMTLIHSGLMNPEVCEKTRAGWETSLVRLQEIVSAENG